MRPPAVPHATPPSVPAVPSTAAPVVTGVDPELRTADLTKVAEEVQFTADLAVALFYNSPDAIVVVDVDGIVRMVNTQAEFLFGYHNTELRGQSVEKLVPLALGDAHRKHRAEFVNDPRVRAMGAAMNLYAVRKDGSRVAVLINLAPVVTPRGTFVIATVRRKTG